jgi:hypothetical protein
MPTWCTPETVGPTLNVGLDLIAIVDFVTRAVAAVPPELATIVAVTFAMRNLPCTATVGEYVPSVAPVMTAQEFGTTPDSTDCSPGHEYH